MTVPRKEIFFVDTNVLAYWLLGRGNILSSILDRFKLMDEFLNIYRERYSDAINFIDRIIETKGKGIKNEFFVSNFAINESFSVIKDELRTILLLKKGIPISRWKDQLYSPEINSEDYEFIYKLILKQFDIIFEGRSIEPSIESSPEEYENYYDVYTSILFLIRDAKTQDSTLLTTAILNGADYFVTKDDRLIGSANKMMKDSYQMELIRPSYAINILKMDKTK